MYSKRCRTYPRVYFQVYGIRHISYIWSKFLIIGFKIHCCNGWRFTCIVSVREIWHVYNNNDTIFVLINFENKIKMYICIMSSRKKIYANVTCLSVNGYDNTARSHLQSKPSKEGLRKGTKKDNSCTYFWIQTVRTGLQSSVQLPVTPWQQSPPFTRFPELPTSSMWKRTVIFPSI